MSWNATKRVQGTIRFACCNTPQTLMRAEADESLLSSPALVTPLYTAGSSAREHRSAKPFHSECTVQLYAYMVLCARPHPMIIWFARVLREQRTIKCILMYHTFALSLSHTVSGNIFYELQILFECYHANVWTISQCAFDIVVPGLAVRLIRYDWQSRVRF